MTYFLIVLCFVQTASATDSKRRRGRGEKDQVRRYEITQQCDRIAHSPFPRHIYLPDSKKSELENKEFISGICAVLNEQTVPLQKLFKFFPVRKNLHFSALHSLVSLNAGADASGEITFVFNLKDKPSKELFSLIMAHEYGHLVLLDLYDNGLPANEWSNSLKAMHELFADAFAAFYFGNVELLPQSLYEMGFHNRIEQRKFNSQAITHFEFDPLLAYHHAATQESRRHLFINGFFKIITSRTQAHGQLKKLRNCIVQTEESTNSIDPDQFSYKELNILFIQSCSVSI